MLSRELVSASSKPLVLSVLSDGESYGYAIIQRVRELSHQEITWTDGMLYPVLHRLEQEGLIESDWRDSPGGANANITRSRTAAEKHFAMKSKNGFPSTTPCRAYGKSGLLLLRKFDRRMAPRGSQRKNGDSGTTS